MGLHIPETGMRGSNSSVASASWYAGGAAHISWGLVAWPRWSFPGRELGLLFTVGDWDGWLFTGGDAKGWLSTGGEEAGLLFTGGEEALGADAADGSPSLLLRYSWLLTTIYT